MLFNGRSITSKEGDTYIFGKNKIDGQYTYYATLSVQPYDGVALGIMNLQNGDYKFLYWSSKQYNIGHKTGIEGTGYKAGEKIKVTVDLNEGFIKW